MQWTLGTTNVKVLQSWIGPTSSLLAGNAVECIVVLVGHHPSKDSVHLKRFDSGAPILYENRDSTTATCGTALPSVTESPGSRVGRKFPFVDRSFCEALIS